MIILGVDPSINKVGLAVIKVDLDNYNDGCKHVSVGKEHNSYEQASDANIGKTINTKRYSINEVYRNVSLLYHSTLITEKTITKAKKNSNIDDTSMLGGNGNDITTSNKLGLIESSLTQAKLGVVSFRLIEIQEKYSPEYAVVENIFVSKNARSALLLGQARGGILATLGMLGILSYEYTPLEIKNRITGYGLATKEQVRSEICRILGRSEDEFGLDESDAIAMALTLAVDLCC